MRILTFEDYKDTYQRSVEDPSLFWGEIADHFVWHKKWSKVLDYNFDDPNINWFVGAKCNITENCLDRHLVSNGHKTAIIWEPNNTTEQSITLTYQQLYMKVVQFAQVLKNNGVQNGDRVCIYMGMVPELSIAILACARIGAIHSVIFGGFSAQSIADRIQDAQAAFVITCDGAYRGAKQIELKSVIDDALVQCDFVRRVIVLERTGTPTAMIKGRDVWWADEIRLLDNNALSVSPTYVDAEDPLFILYTSGSTGKPKGVVHTTAGYMVYTTYSFVNTFQYEATDIHFCTADIGWITGHSYILYGPLCAGATTVLYEGTPSYPDAGRLWEIIDKHKVTTIYTAPTAIRSLMAAGLAPFEGKDLSTLKILGTVGEPINEEAWQWYHHHVGRGRLPIVDTWWQTETGAIMISNLAGITPAKPCFATLPLPGIQPILLDDKGVEITAYNVSGNLCIKFPWPSMIRTTYGDHARCRQTYFSTYPGYYFTGDGCFRDSDGHYRITGRVDDVLNVSGHRIGTAELENAINMHTGVVESAIVGYPHDIKGQGIYAYVIYDTTHHAGDMSQIGNDICQTVAKIIGPIAKPDKIQIVSGLPKTRSGKIMRRILRKIAEGDLQNLGDTSTLLDSSVIDEIIQGKI
jgi:acetyl-CoA synthetase